jgi:hydroxymethylpyrimidine/phosphomethylpyrimidine kinase
MLDIGASEDWLGLQMALSPCMLGYVTAAKMLVSHPQTRRDGNIYWPWIKNYAEDCEESIKKHSGQSTLTGMRRWSTS